MYLEIGLTVTEKHVILFQTVKTRKLSYLCVFHFQLSILPFRLNIAPIPFLSIICSGR